MKSSEIVKDTVGLRFKLAKFVYAFSYEQTVGIKQQFNQSVSLRYLKITPSIASRLFGTVV